MERSQYSSRLLDNAVNQFATLPGIGRRTALRLVLHLLREDKNDVLQFVDAVRAVRSDICYCKLCHNISDNEICDICANAERDHRTICVVENIRDVMAIENTHQYRGVYHVLGGVISPMDGIGPDDLNISSLEERLVNGEADEVILALSTTLEGDTTLDNFFSMSGGAVTFTADKLLTDDIEVRNSSFKLNNKTVEWQTLTVVTDVGVTMPSITRSNAHYFLYSASSGSTTPQGTQTGRIFTAYTAGTVEPTTETIYYLGRLAQ